MNYSIQLYSIRDITPKDMDLALKKIAQIGYSHVEFAGFFGHGAREIRSMLDEYGLSVSGTHTGWEEIANNFSATVEYHKTIGNNNIIIPGFDYSSREKLDAFIAFLNEYYVKLREEGIALGYHNHSGEFYKTEYGAMVHEEIREKTPVELEIDTFWAYNAGESPTKLMDEFKDRIRVIHIKDGLVGGVGKPLGLGSAPVAEVYKKSLDNGVLMCVESETLTPDGLTEAQICFEHLKKLEAMYVK